METLGDILRRIATTRKIPGSESHQRIPADFNEIMDSCDICRGRGWYTLDTPVGHPEFGQVTVCECQETKFKLEQSGNLLRYSNLGPLSRFTFDTIDTHGRSLTPEGQRKFSEAYQSSVKYSDNPKGWLVLAGSNGSGKTILSAAIANSWINKGYLVFFVHVSDLVDHLRATFSPTSDISYSELFEQVKNTPFLILDGLGSQSTTSWAQEKLHQIINHRYNAQLPTVITTDSEFSDFDSFIASRLNDQELSHILEVGIRDRNPVHNLGRIDPEMLNRMTFETFDVRGNNSNKTQSSSIEGAYAAAKNFAADPDGWFTLFGETGVGKTHLAVAIAAYRLQSNHPVFFAFVPELLDYMRHTFRPESRVTYDNLFDEIKNTPLLILDDMGQEHSSPWAQEKLYQIIVHRHNARLSSVITSRLDFIKHTGPISSRIRDPYVGQLVRLDAPDYRVKSR